LKKPNAAFSTYQNFSNYAENRKVFEKLHCMLLKSVEFFNNMQDTDPETRKCQV